MIIIKIIVVSVFFKCTCDHRDLHVLTHSCPTRRSSDLITELMRLRLHGHTRTDTGRDIETELRRHILTLWQTALVRLSRLKISDEIETGLRYYPAALLDVIPRVNAEVRTAQIGRASCRERVCQYV